MISPRVEAGLRKIGWRPEAEVVEEIITAVESGWSHDELLHLLKERLRSAGR